MSVIWSCIHRGRNAIHPILQLPSQLGVCFAIKRFWLFSLLKLHKGFYVPFSRRREPCCTQWRSANNRLSIFPPLKLCWIIDYCGLRCKHSDNRFFVPSSHSFLPKCAIPTLWKKWSWDIILNWRVVFCPQFFSVFFFTNLTVSRVFFS